MTSARPAEIACMIEGDSNLPQAESEPRRHEDAATGSIRRGRLADGEGTRGTDRSGEGSLIKERAIDLHVQR